MAEINVVPYIDVMLVLLIIFMVTAPLLQQGVEVDLPTAGAKVLPAAPKPPMVVSVNQQGEYFLNIMEQPNTLLSASALALRVAAELRLDPQRKVLVKGDQKVDYGKVVGAMVLLQQAGAPSVGLVTQDEAMKG
jgi:biopolymer transport protein TolR